MQIKSLQIFYEYEEPLAVVGELRRLSHLALCSCSRISPGKLLRLRGLTDLRSFSLHYGHYDPNSDDKLPGSLSTLLSR